jgi:protocatechuate 3,4-dioxygenase, alpha subunit
MTLTPSGSQTVGPFFRIGLEYLCAKRVTAGSAGAVTIAGSVLDANGVPVPDALLEFWYESPEEPRDGASTELTHRHSSFIRVATDDEGRFQFSVNRPDPQDRVGDVKQAPHFDVLVFSRGLLRHLITRMYLPDEPANETDPILQSVQQERRHTLVAHPDSQHRKMLEWNVVLQGKDETVFFAW